MQITLELPEDVAQGLESKWKDLTRAALESLALEAYRSHALTAAQLRRLLGFETRMQVDVFLKEHEVYDFTAADFEQDRETLRQKLGDRGVETDRASEIALDQIAQPEHILHRDRPIGADAPELTAWFRDPGGNIMGLYQERIGRRSA